MALIDDDAQQVVISAVLDLASRLKGLEGDEAARSSEAA